ncbi:MAG: HIT family protein [Thaumarchaeota archaeon]|nr:HIT family protein [Nitrososphaerota archaeon]
MNQMQLKLDGEENLEEHSPEFHNSQLGCPFCLIVRKETPAYIVFEDEVSLAFLDRRPIFYGHCLLIPKDHYETLSDLARSLIDPLFANAQLLVRAIPTATGADGTFVGINNKVSQSVPHLHIHIVPRKTGDHLRGFFWPRQKYKDDLEMSQISNSIKVAVDNILENQKK